MQERVTENELFSFACERYHCDACFDAPPERCSDPLCTDRKGAWNEIVVRNYYDLLKLAKRKFKDEALAADSVHDALRAAMESGSLCVDQHGERRPFKRDIIRYHLWRRTEDAGKQDRATAARRAEILSSEETKVKLRWEPPSEQVKGNPPPSRKGMGRQELKRLYGSETPVTLETDAIDRESIEIIQEALCVSLRSLAPRERLLLRMVVIQQFSLAIVAKQHWGLLGAKYDAPVDKATASRRTNALSTSIKERCAEHLAKKGFEGHASERAIALLGQLLEVTGYDNMVNDSEEVEAGA